MLGRKGEFKHRAVRLEHLRQHARRQLARQLPLGFGTQVAKRVGVFGQRGAVVQRHRRARLPHQQTVLGQKAGKQHAVPVLVGHFPNQTLHRLGVVSCLGIAQRAAVGAQAAAQGFFVVGKVVGGLGLTHSQLGQRGAGAVFSHVAGGFDGVF